MIKIAVNGHVHDGPYEAIVALEKLGVTPETAWQAVAQRVTALQQRPPLYKKLSCVFANVTDVTLEVFEE